MRRVMLRTITCMGNDELVSGKDNSLSLVSKQTEGEYEYRYAFERVWDEKERYACFILLNPATFNGNDMTARFCTEWAKNYSEDCSFGGVVIVNLFSRITPKPADLRKEDYVSDRSTLIGPHCETYLSKILDDQKCGAFIAGWGNTPSEWDIDYGGEEYELTKQIHDARHEQIALVRELVGKRKDVTELKCLRLTKK